jgi:5-hydroxyisourate hydrolase
MPGLSVHAVDVTRGVPARGMRIEVFALAPQRRLIAEGELAASGVLEHALAKERLQPGAYDVVFHAGAYFTAARPFSLTSRSASRLPIPSSTITCP